MPPCTGSTVLRDDLLTVVTGSDRRYGATPAGTYRIGSTIYDGSVKAQLQQLKQRLVNA